MKKIVIAQGAEEAVEEPAEHVSSLQPDIPPPREHARHTKVRLMLLPAWKNNTPRPQHFSIVIVSVNLLKSE